MSEPRQPPSLPPKASGPSSFPVKRVGLKRTMSVGASPKKQAIVSKFTGGGSNIVSNRFAPGSNQQNSASSSQSQAGSGEPLSPRSRASSSSNSTKPQPGSISTFESGKSNQPSVPPKPVLSSGRPSLGSNTTVKPGGIVQNSPFYASDNGKQKEPSTTGQAMSPLDLTKTTASQPSTPSTLSPRQAALAKFENLIESNTSPDDAISSPARPKRPTAPPKPQSAATLRSSSNLRHRASVATIFPTSPDSAPPASSSDNLTSSLDAAAKEGAPVPKTGAQMRPPVPKKNISQSPIADRNAANRSPSPTPAPAERPSTFRSSMELRSQSVGPHPQTTAKALRPAPPPPTKGSANAESVESSDESEGSQNGGTVPVFTRTRTPKALPVHFRSATNHSLTSSSSDISIAGSDALAESPVSESPIASSSAPSKAVDEKGRVVTIGKPRDANYYQLDLAALDLETTSKKKAKPFKIGNFAKGIANLVPKRSPSETSLEIVEEVDDSTDTSNWPTLKREKKEWPELHIQTVPDDVLSMIDRSVTTAGFHIEFGDPNLVEKPPLYLDHQKEYLPYYGDFLYPVEHSNYMAYDDESDTYWIVSIEDKPRSKKQDALRALVRSRKDYVRVNIDVSTLTSSFTDNFTKGSSIKMTALCKMMPELEKLKFTRVKNPELNDELRSMEEKEIKLGSAYKFGVLYVKPNQTEDQIFANNDPSPAFLEFLEMMGTKIELLGWQKYRGGLDVKNQSTGEHSIYHEIHGVSVMFHVCTMLPSQENDLQRVERKRHIGNDLVTFVFLEEGCEPYLATKLTSQFIHVHIVVQKVPGTGVGTDVNAYYRLAIVTKYGVEPHYPSFACPPILEKSPATRDFLITKAINAERTCMLATEFRSKMLRARKDFLKHLYENFSKTKKARGSSPSNH